MSKGTVTALVVMAVVALAVYCISTGATLAGTMSWAERQLGVRAEKPELKSVPYTNYGPVVVPGR